MILFDIRRASIRWAATIACCAIVTTPPRAQEGFDRGAIRRDLDSTIERARKYINKPGVLSDILRTLDEAAGDDPRVLAFCGEIVEKSTNDLSLHHAVNTLGRISGFYLGDKRQAQIIEEIVLRASRKGDEMVKLDGWNVLSSMGGEYKREAHEGYMRLLSAKYRAQDARRHKVRCVETIQDFLRSSPLDAADIAAIRKATDRLDLLSFYKREMLVRDTPTGAEASQKFLDQWRAVLDSKTRSGP